MIIWTFQIELLKKANLDKRQTYGITFTELNKNDNSSSFNISSKEVALETFSVEKSPNSSIGRQRKILTNLWKIYHQRKERIRKSLQPIKFEPVDDNILVVSAFYDTRRKNAETGSEYVRIVAISKRQTHDNLMCSFNKRQLHEWTLADKAELSDGHDREFGSYVYSCMVPDSLDKSPDYVYLDSLDNVESQNRLAVKLEMPKNMNSRKPLISQNFTSMQDQGRESLNKTILGRQLVNHSQQGQQLSNQSEAENSQLSPLNRTTIALCVPPIYGHIPISNLVQFIEIYAMLKIDHFYMYNLNISDNVLQALKYYTNKKMLSILPWHVPDNVNGKVWYNGQVAAIHDCLYRTMQQEFDYAVLVDLDEIIVPRNHQSIPDMLTDMESKFILNVKTETHQKSQNTVAAFKFQSAFFNPDQMPVTNSVQRKWTLPVPRRNGLSFFNALQRTAQVSSERTKLIVRPNLIQHLGIHHVSKMLDRSAVTYEVPIQTALINHYRPCIETTESTFNCQDTILDDSILKFENEVQNSYDVVINEYISQKKR